jgi:hypothetical protein
MPPTFNHPGLAALPIHKQILLSPLLASSHFLAAARKAYGFPTPTTSIAQEQPPDVLAEHKALLERFRASAQAMAAAAAVAANNNKEDHEKPPASPPTMRSPTLLIRNGSPVHFKPKEGSGPTPMDLSKRSSEEEDSISSVGSEIIPNLSDTDEDVDDNDAIADDTTNAGAAKVNKRKPEEILPLDLTCV